MNNVIVRFFNGNTVVRTESFSSEIEAEIYVASERIAYDYYTIETGDIDVV